MFQQKKRTNDDFIGSLLMGALGIPMQPKEKDPIQYLLGMFGIPARDINDESTKEEEEEFKPKTDERGLMTDVEELRDLVNITTEYVREASLEAFKASDNPIVCMKMLELAIKAKVAHDLVCDCKRRKKPEATKQEEAGDDSDMDSMFEADLASVYDGEDFEDGDADGHDQAYEEEEDGD